MALNVWHGIARSVRVSLSFNHQHLHPQAATLQEKNIEGGGGEELFHLICLSLPNDKIPLLHRRHYGKGLELTHPFIHIIFSRPVRNTGIRCLRDMHYYFIPRTSRPLESSEAVSHLLAYFHDRGRHHTEIDEETEAVSRKQDRFSAMSHRDEWAGHEG